MTNVYKVAALTDFVAGCSSFLYGLAIGYGNAVNYLLCGAALLIIYEGYFRYRTASYDDFSPFSKKAFFVSLVISFINLAAFAAILILCIIFRKVEIWPSFGIVGLLTSGFLIVFHFLSRKTEKFGDDPLRYKDLEIALGTSVVLAFLLTIPTLLCSKNLPEKEEMIGFVFIAAGFLAINFLNYAFDDFLANHIIIDLLVNIISLMALSAWAFVALYFYNQSIESIYQPYSDGFTNLFWATVISEGLLFLGKFIRESKSYE